MRVTRAYLAGLGTTGVLLAASLLMLVLVSALVSFDRWPGATVPDPAERLVLAEEPVVPVSGPAAAADADADDAAPGGAGAGAAGDGSDDAPATPRRDRRSRDPDPNTQDPEPPVAVPPTPPTPARTPNPVADATEQVTRDLGGAVGGVSPGLGQTVTGAGQTVSEALRDPRALLTPP